MHSHCQRQKASKTYVLCIFQLVPRLDKMGTMYLFPHVCKVWGMISIRRLYFDKKVLKRQIQSIVMFWKFWLCLLYLCYVLWQKQHQCEKSVRKITQQNVWLDYKFLGKELLPQPIKTERGKWSHHAKLQIFCDEKHW